MEERIRREEDRDFWEYLHKLWIRDGKPGYLVLSNDTYRVLRPGNDEIIFLKENPRDYYESRSI